MKGPIYLRKEPQGYGAYLHDAFDKHLGYISRIENAERIVAMVNAMLAARKEPTNV